MSIQPPSFLPRRQTGILGTILGAARSVATLPQDIVGTLAAELRATPQHIVTSITDTRKSLQQYREGAPDEASPRGRRAPPPPPPEAEAFDLGPPPEGLDSGAPWLTRTMALPYGARQVASGASPQLQTLVYPYASARAPRRLPSLRS